jgi:glutaminyl-peptide cyclotransferase
MPILFLSFFKLLLLTLTPNSAHGVSWDSLQWHQKAKVFEHKEILVLSDHKNEHWDHFNKTLDKILRVRVPGTPGHKKVNRFIVNEMKTMGWEVEEDAFRADTPHGNRPFRNIIATFNPKACKRLVLSCHYDSKHSREDTFLGATDSAVPCAMLIHLAKTLDTPLRAHLKERPLDTSLQLIFFDGEEAFVEWSPSDSLYGSRHLADKWNRTPFPVTSEEKHQCQGDYVSELDRIDVLVLLDLLGTSNPNFYSFFSNTNSLYARLLKIEHKLNELKALEPHPPEEATSYFINKQSFGYIEDDHIPFFKKGVPILHIIPTPFPSCWHKDCDNGDLLHHPTINNLIKLFRVFVAEYLHLNPLQMV